MIGQLSALMFELPDCQSIVSYLNNKIRYDINSVM